MDEEAHQPVRTDVTSLFSQSLRSRDKSDSNAPRDWNADLPFIGYTYRSFDAASLAFNKL